MPCRTPRRRRHPRTDLAAFGLILLGFAAVPTTGARAEGFIFTVAANGALLPVSADQGGMPQIGAGAGERLFLFSAPAEGGAADAGDGPGLDVHAAPPAAVARPEILAAIEDTAFRYGSHAGLRAAGLSVSDWALLFRANIEVESAYNPAALSHAGAIGLGQLMPDTARFLGVDPDDWQQNLDGSARYLLMMLEAFGSADLALAAYNAGPEPVTRHGGIPPYTETQGHVARVEAVVQRLRGTS